ncbi:MAG TPA: cyanophycinase [Tepidisphaeraceae bacterium]|jgi:cyanophycinase|nr:cyanophycinase [Tepidisphaeraceae bacterium]
MNALSSSRIFAIFCLALAVSLGIKQGAFLLAADSPASTDHLDPDGIAGSLVLCGGGKLPDVIREKFIELAGGKSARLVVIPTASGDDSVDVDAKEVAEIWMSREPASVTIIHTRRRDVADSPAFVEPLRNATGVWITGGRQSQLAATYSGTLVEKELAALVARGGVVGGTSAGAACQSRVMIVRGQVHPSPGLGLIPGAIVDQHFLARDRRARLAEALAAHPALVGLGIDEGTALIVRGRQMRCLGNSTVTICLASGSGRPARDVELKSGQVSDYTMFRREARDRTLPLFPPEKPAPPIVPHGALVIVGGGGMPDDITQKFIELAGGPESLIVVLPTANPEPSSPRLREGAFLVKAGAKNVKVLPARRLEEVESPEVLDTLKEARGIWFGGGRQWRFVDAYEGTKAIDAFHEVLRRDGVIGGSSAGATIQGDYLVRGSPLGNEEMMAAGYERGFAFLPGTAIDQHFSQRKRFADMTGVMAAHPQLLGIGLDEATAIVVQGHIAEIVGKNKAHFYDRLRPTVGDEPDYTSVAAGGKYDLMARQVATEP